jgi:hypothetical protein
VIAKEIDITIPTNGFVYDGTLDSLRIVDRIGAANFLVPLFVISFPLDMDIKNRSGTWNDDMNYMPYPNTDVEKNPNLHR